jgi:hypothetical protein
MATCGKSKPDREYGLGQVLVLLATYLPDTQAGASKKNEGSAKEHWTGDIGWI